ncbi:MAG: hypothetical protein DRI46_12115, partial [Chloroflexi bacterium]
IVVYKGDRASAGTVGDELGRVVADPAGNWEIYYDDWAAEVFVICTDPTGLVKYAAEVKDWVTGIVATAPVPADPVNLVVNGDAETGDLTSWTTSSAGTVVSVDSAGRGIFDGYVFSGGDNDSYSSEWQWVAIPSGARKVVISSWTKSHYADTDNAFANGQFFQSDQTTLISDTAGTQDATTGPRCKLIEVQAAVPAGAEWIKVWMKFDRNAGTANNCRLDDVWVQFDPVDTLWPAVEPEAASVVSRLNFDGVEGATTVTDLATVPPAWTFEGNSEINADVNPFGAGNDSLRLEADGDYLTTSDLTGVFGNVWNTVATIRFWAKFDQMSDDGQWQGVFFMGDPSQHADRLQLGVAGDQIKLFVAVGNVTKLEEVVSTSEFLKPNTWSQFALMRFGRNLALFIDGAWALGGYVEADTNITDQISLGFAKSSSTVLGMKGNIADVQILSGAAPHRVNFTPPISPLPIP